MDRTKVEMGLAALERAAFALVGAIVVYAARAVLQGLSSGSLDLHLTPDEAAIVGSIAGIILHHGWAG